MLKLWLSFNLKFIEVSRFDEGTSCDPRHKLCLLFMPIGGLRAGGQSICGGDKSHLLRFWLPSLTITIAENQVLQPCVMPAASHHGVPVSRQLKGEDWKSGAVSLCDTGMGTKSRLLTTCLMF